MIKLTNFIKLYKFARVSHRTTNTSSKPPNTNNMKPIISQLNDRCLISLEGPDAKKVLQGIMTNDMDKISHNDKFAAIYTAFLNIKGRLVADAIIIKPRIFNQDKLQYKENEYWIDLHIDQKNILSQHISKYCWKKNVKITNIQNDVKICVMYNDHGMSEVDSKHCGMLVEPPDAIKGIHGKFGNISYIDPRFPPLGVRMIMNGDQYTSQNFEIIPTQNYNTYKSLHAVVEGPEMTDKIPFQYNIDLLRGISFTKGCYIGQQLIARSYHTGIVRRRIFPFVLQDQSKAGQFGVGKPIFRDNIQIGKVTKFNKENGLGLGLINYIDIEPFSQLQIKSPCKIVLLNPLQRQINQYLQTLKQKQASQQKLDQ